MIAAGAATAATMGMVGGFAIAQPVTGSTSGRTSDQPSLTTPSTSQRSTTTTPLSRSGRGYPSSPSTTQPGASVGGSAQPPSTNAPSTQQQPRARSRAS
ncbi:MAG: hypothetical protein HYX32_09250 [Actinobacteria bacterium]|nr:hypothetical protein [Actinomycetota bacterium]